MNGKTEKLKLSSLSREQIRGFIAVSVAQISAACTGSLLEPFLPPEARSHGVSTSLNGILLSTYYAVMFSTAMIFGLLTGFIGAKAMLLIGITIKTSTSISIGMLEFIEQREEFVEAAFILIAFDSLAWISIYTATTSLAAKLFPLHINLVIGMSEMYYTIAEGLTLLPAAILHDIGGFHMPFLVYGAIHGLLAFPTSYFLLPPMSAGQKLQDVATEVEPTKRTTRLRPYHLLKIPRTMLIALIIPMLGAFWAFLGANLEEHLSSLKLSKMRTNMMFLITSVWYGLMSPAVGWASGKLSQKWPLIALGMMGCGLTCAFLGPLPIFGIEKSIWQNAVVLTLLAIQQAICTVPAFEAIISYTIEAGYEDSLATYAIASSLTSTADPMGKFIGAFSGGFMVEHFGFPVAMTIVGAAMFAGGTVAAIYFIFCDKSPGQLEERGGGSPEPSTVIFPEQDSSGTIEVSRL